MHSGFFIYTSKIYITICCLLMITLPTFSITDDIAIPPDNMPKNRPSVALVLSGGGAKGFAHIGVLELLEELDIPIDMIVGNSAGAIAGGLYCAGYSPREIKEALLDQDWTKIFSDSPVSDSEKDLGDRSLFSTPLSFGIGKNLSLDMGQGISIGENAYKLFKQLTVRIPSYIDFDSLPIPFRAATVDMYTGDLKILSSGDLAEAIRASISLPAVFEPFIIDGNYYMDGTVRNNLPIKAAKDMGYDIIIAVEISDPIISNPEDLDSNPLVALSQVFSIYQRAINTPQYEYADLVLYPDVSMFTTLDYNRSQEIYDKGKSEAKRYRQQLLELRAKIYPQDVLSSPENNKILQAEEDQNINNKENYRFVHIADDPLEPDRVSIYDELPLLAAQDIHITGAASEDIAYIRTVFNKIANLPLTPERIGYLIDEIYRTGHYLFVISRIDTRYAKNIIDLHLHQVKHNTINILLGIHYQGTLTNTSSSKFGLSADIQFRNITGPGSLVSINANILNNLSAEILYLQHLSTKAYIQASASFNTEQNFILRGFKNLDQTETYSITSAEGIVIGGVRFTPQHHLFYGGAIKWFDTSLALTENLSPYIAKYPNQLTVAAPITGGYVFDTLDAYTFPTKGVYASIKATGIFPITESNAPIALLTCEADARGIIPIGRRFSIILNGFVGTEPLELLPHIPTAIPVFGYHYQDRIFFPQMTGKQAYGIHKMAYSFGIQFLPWQQLTILGGQLFLALSGGFGDVLMKYTDFNVKHLDWYGAFNTGLRITRNFGILIRFGAGTFQNTIAPFISLDIGNIRL